MQLISYLAMLLQVHSQFLVYLLLFHLFISIYTTLLLSVGNYFLMGYYEQQLYHLLFSLVPRQKFSILINLLSLDQVVDNFIGSSQLQQNHDLRPAQSFDSLRKYIFQRLLFLESLIQSSCCIFLMLYFNDQFEQSIMNCWFNSPQEADRSELKAA